VTVASGGAGPGSALARHPALVLGGALGVGFLAGGGLKGPLGRRLLGMGARFLWRFAALPLLEQAARNALGIREEE
jgi:hypothetical protein